MPGAAIAAAESTLTLVQPVDLSAARVALRLDTRRAELAVAYQDHLLRMNSSLLDESATLSQVMAHIVEALDEVIDCLRGDTQSVHNSVLTRTIGVSRAASGVHPAESLQAAVAAFDVFMVAVAESLNVAEDSVILSAAIIINRVIVSRIESAVSTYCDFLTDKIYCAHIEARSMAVSCTFAPDHAEESAVRVSRPWWWAVTL